MSDRNTLPESYDDDMTREEESDTPMERPTNSVAHQTVLDTIDELRQEVAALARTETAADHRYLRIQLMELNLNMEGMWVSVSHHTEPNWLREKLQQARKAHERAHTLYNGVIGEDKTDYRRGPYGAAYT